MSVRLETHKGIEIFVRAVTGEFYTNEPSLSAASLPLLYQAIERYLKRRRKAGFAPVKVFLIDSSLRDDDPDEEVIVGISGTNGLLRIAGGGSYNSYGGTLVFLPEEYPSDMIQDLRKMREEIEQLQEKIRKASRYSTHRTGRLDGSEVIERERQFNEALTKEREEDSEAPV